MIEATLIKFQTSTVCPRSSDPFYLVSYNIKWGTTSWTYCNIKVLYDPVISADFYIEQYNLLGIEEYVMSAYCNWLIYFIGTFRYVQCAL